jgi:hypothetical protein
MHARLALPVLVVLFLLLLALPASALAWANGSDCGNDFGDDDWMLAQANRLAAVNTATSISKGPLRTCLMTA